MKRQLFVPRARILSTVAFVLLLLWAWSRTPPVVGGQAAVPLSKPGQEDLTFWINHNGLEEVYVEGPVGLGDMARLLMRRRANAASIRKLRDRFTFPIRDIAAIETADVFRAVLTGSGLQWQNRPKQLVVPQNLIFNLPLIVENRTSVETQVQARFLGSEGEVALESSFPRSDVAPNDAGAYFLRVLASESGSGKGHLFLQVGENKLEAEIALDVRPLVKLKVHLVDENGQPTAARVYLTASDGLAYAPRGTISRMTAMSAEYYFHTENSFELELPAGRTLIEATRGLEYELASQSLDLKPGHPQEVWIRLKRWENLAAKGWYSSDAHIHANYTRVNHDAIRPEDVRLQTLAEDLNNANMMVANGGSSFLYDLQYFEGKPNALSSPSYIIYWNEEMRHRGLYGHMCFYNLKSLVYPVYTGFAGTPYWEDYPPNYTQAKGAQEQGGAVTYAHPMGGGGQRKPSTPSGQGGLATGLRPPTDVTSFATSGVKELPVDLALGQVDALDVFSNADEIGSMEVWYGLLNCGFKLAISAGSDSFTNVADHYTPGGGRVYVHTGQPLRYEEWIRGYKQGRSFASNGPMIFFTVDGKEPGDELRFPANSEQTVRVKATVRTLIPLEKVEVVVNGRVAISRSAAGEKEIVVDEGVPLNKSAWLAVRAYGPWHRLVLNDLQTFAHTSPVYVQFGEQPVASRSDLAFYSDWIERLIAAVDTRGSFATPQRKQEVMELFRRALSVYRERERRITSN